MGDKGLVKFCPRLLHRLAELHLDLGHGRNHLDLRKIIEHRQQRFVRIDEAVPSHFSRLVGAAQGQR